MIDHLIPDDQKDREWILKAVKHYWGDCLESGFKSMYHARNMYRHQRQYALSKQPIDKYKKSLGIADSGDQTLLSVDFTPLAIPTKFRNLALAIADGINYDIAATPIDTLAQSQIDEYFRVQEAKIKLRAAAAKINPELADEGPLARQADEPMDLDELEIHKKYTYRHQLSIEIEQWLELIFDHNNMDEVRSTVRQDIFDCGMGGVKECMDASGTIVVRPVRPDGFICGRAYKRDFSDAEYMGEVYEMSVSKLMQEAGSQIAGHEYKEIVQRHKSPTSRVFTNTGLISQKDYDDTKVNVLDIEFFSTSEFIYQDTEDKRGNSRFTRTSRDRAKGMDVSSLKVVHPQVIYTAKWVVGTDQMYDFGLAQNMKRRISRLSETSFSYSMFAPNWDPHSMTALGYMEQIIPVIDQMNLAWFRLQHTIATARPRGVAIEIGSIEDISLGKGGVLKKAEIIDLYNTTGNLLFRRTGLDGQSQNWMPIQELDNGLGRQAEEYFGVIMKCIQILRDTLGLNEATDSFTGSRTYGAAVEAAIAATNNSLHGIVNADYQITKKASNDIMLRVQGGIRNKTLNKGYETALGTNSIRFLSTSPNIGVHEFALKLERRQSIEERARFSLRIDEYVKAGQLDIEDALLIENNTNLKAAGQILAYKVRRKKDEAIRMSRQAQMDNAQAQAMAAQAAEQSRQQTLAMEMEGKMKLLTAEKEWDYRIEQMKKLIGATSTEQLATINSQIESMKQESKEYIAEMAVKAKTGRNSGQVVSDAVR